MVDVNSKGITKPLSESPISVTSSVGKGIGKNISELLNIADIIKKDIATQWLESFQVVSVCGKHVDKALSEQVISVATSIGKDIGKDLSEQFGMTDDMSKHATIQLSETLRVVDNTTKAISKNLNDNFGITDSRSVNIGKNIQESVTIVDNMSRVVDFIRVLEETISVSDQISKDVAITKMEYVGIVDDMLRAANVVISDILVDAADMTLEEFNALSVPVGYEQFRLFANGDYDYQRALIRIIVEATVGQNRPLLEAWKLAIDVDDINDRGSVTTLVSGPVRVLFNKEYHEAPEVNITIKSCADINAKYSISNIDIDGFDIALIDSNGQYIDGIISWFSVGV